MKDEEELHSGRVNGKNKCIKAVVFMVDETMYPLTYLQRLV